MLCERLASLLCVCNHPACAAFSCIENRWSLGSTLYKQFNFQGVDMKITQLIRGLTWAVLLAMLMPLSVSAAPVGQATFADPAFARMWTRTDELVSNGTVKRSFYWGPKPLSGPIAEAYAEGTNGKHLVQYFDKGRMEVNDPGADPANPFYVTPGR